MDNASLRTDIELKDFEISTEIINYSDNILKSFEDFQISLNSLESICNQIDMDINQYKDLTKEFLNIESSLEMNMSHNKEKKDIINNFFEKYQLSSYDIHVLTDGNIDDNFFKTLDKAEDIYKNFEHFSRSQHQRIATKLLDAISIHKENAYKHIVGYYNPHIPIFIYNDILYLHPFDKINLERMGI